MASRGRKLSPAGCCCRLLWLLSTLSCWPPPTVVGARSSSASSSAALQEASIRPELIEALLAESLRLHLVQACQGERVSLHCPRNTHISPQNSFFGRLVPSRELCPGQAPQQSEDTSCDFAEAHSHVQELCRAKRKCRLWVRPELFGERDPCPGTGKYLQIGYKCSPVSFEDQNFCEGQQTRLGCKQGQRLSIYSAHFGRTVNGQAMHCDGGKGGAGGGERPLVQKDCVADVLPQIARRCHAQPWCSFPVDSRFLGSPCPAGVPKYLSVIFVCVNEEVFSEAALRGRLEAMEQLDRELNSLRRNASGQPVPTPNSWRHPLLGDRRSEEESEEEEEEEEQQQQQHFEVDEQRRTKDGPAAEWTEVEEQKTPVAETNSAVVEAKTSAEIGEPNRNREEDWPWALLAEHRRQALLPWLLLLLLFPCLLAVLSACLLWQCRARLRERKERKRAEERAANNRKLGDGRFCAQPTSSAGGYLLDSDGSSQRLLPLPSDTFLPSPPVQYNNGNGSDIYHGCYVPTLGSCSAGSGSAYGGSGGGGGGGYYMGMGGGHFSAGRMPTTTAAAATTEEFAWAQLRRLPPSLHCYS